MISLRDDIVLCTMISKLVWIVDKRKPIQGVLIHGMCNFADGTRAATARFPRSLCSLGMTPVGHPHPNEHSFKTFLYTVCACSECEPQGGEKANAELDV